MLRAACIGLGILALASPSAAQTGGAAPAPKAEQSGTRLITLGTTAGPLPRKDRAQAANLLIVNGTPYLIDAGDGVTRRIVQAGANFRQIGTIFITHHHSDHMAGLATLMAVEWEFNRRQPINVYGPPGTKRVVKAALEYFAVNAEIRSTEGKTFPMHTIFVGHDVGTGPIFQDANIKVTAIENTHFNIPKDSPYDGKHKSYSYRFRTADRVIVFTGDTGPSDALTKFAKGADLLLSEVASAEEIKQRRIKSGDWHKMSALQQQAFMRHLTTEHVTPEEVGKMASRAGVKTVVLTHLPSSGKDNDDYQRFAEEVSKFYSGRVVVANDLMEF
jgi:ribonuclease BN (tRNA processing enzyme)